MTTQHQLEYQSSNAAPRGADAYNEIKLVPENQQGQTLSTQCGVLLRQCLPFGIKSVLGYFQVMENLITDLPGVVIFQDFLLISRKNANDHLSNQRHLLSRLNDKRLRCCHEKCLFTQTSVEYLDRTLSTKETMKGSEVKAVMKMQLSTDIPSLKSFMCSIQFYEEFIPSLATVTEPLYHLTKKATH